MLGEGPEKDWEEQCRPLFPWPGLTPLSLLHETLDPLTEQLTFSQDGLSPPEIREQQELVSISTAHT